MINVRLLFLIIGILLTVLSVFMLIPAFVDLHAGHSDWTVFMLSAFLTLFFGAGLYISNKCERAELDLRSAFILTGLSWVSLSFFSALPLMFSELNLRPVDAWFETVSALTTTGATVLTGIDSMPPGILLWRSLLQWLGGIGIIVLAMALLPALKIGGMQLFRAESSDRSDKALPRAAQICTAIGVVYVLFTAVCAALLWGAGMTLFDAVCHAMCTVATAGFSTRDASIGYYNNAMIEVIIIVFMLLSALPFVWYIKAREGRYRDMFKDAQVRAFLLCALFAVTLIAFWLSAHKDIPFAAALRHAAFNTVSVLTTTGFASQNYAEWGTFAVALLFFLSVFGGCTGSTTGGIKTLRIVILIETARTQIARLIQPNAVVHPRFNRKIISKDVSLSAMSFVTLFGLSFIVITILLAMTGLDFVTAASASASSLANLGPGTGDIIGPAGNYASLSDFAKWILTFAMLLGRLEIFTILILFAPRFWRL